MADGTAREPCAIVGKTSAYLVVFPDGSIDLFTHDAASVLATATSREALAPFHLDRFTVNPDFHLRRPLIVWFESYAPLAISDAPTAT